MAPLMPDSVQILSVRVHRVTMRESLALVDAMASSGRAHHVVTVNPEFIMTAQTNGAFRDVLNGADLALPDGMGIVHAARLLGKPVRERVTGVDFVNRFAEIAAARGYRLFLLGAAPGVAERAAAVLCRDWPGLIVAGTYAGSPHPREEAEICSRIAAARPHVLLVAYGSPGQDLWIARTRERLNVPVSIGVGGTLDYIAGVVKRAPEWACALGMEWTYRLVSQPSRWRRMLALPQFAAAVCVQALSSRAQGTRPQDKKMESAAELNS